MNEDKIIDQSQLAEDVARKIPYEFTDSFLVKPLDKIMIKKEVTKLPNTKPVKDDNGIEAVEGEPTTEIKEVESDFSKGIILKRPINYELQMNSEKESGKQYMAHFNVGDIIVYKTTATRPFDLLKDSRLIKSYDILAIVNND